MEVQNKEYFNYSILHSEESGISINSIHEFNSNILSMIYGVNKKVLPLINNSKEGEEALKLVLKTYKKK